MRTVVLFPTIEEAKGFLLTEPHVPVFVSGAGPAQTAAAVVRAVKARKPHLVVLAGLAAACDRTQPLGEAVEVTSQFEAALSGAERHTYRVDPVTDLPEAAGCSAETEFPPTGCGPHGRTTAAAEPETAKCGSGAVPAAERTTSPDEAVRTESPRVVSREGAALMAVCEALGIRCCEIRVASHYAGETLSPEARAYAAERLTETLNEIFENHEQE